MIMADIILSRRLVGVVGRYLAPVLGSTLDLDRPCSGKRFLSYGLPVLPLL